MQIRNTVIAVILSVAICSISFATPNEDHPAAQAWRQYASIEELGWSAEKLAEARAFSEEIGSAAAMLIWRGHVVFAWGDIDRPFRCHSVRKSFLSALYGIAVDEGKINLDETVGDLNIDDISPLSDAEKKARIEDLIMSRSGIYHPAAKETEGHRRTRPERGSHVPGEHWWYNNWDFNLAGVVFEMKTAENIFLAFKRHIAKPLGMKDFKLDDTWYQWERRVTNHPAYAFKLSARDRARFGQLFLQKGRWKGEQVISAKWVEKSTSSLTKFDEDSGYGYMWWTSDTSEKNKRRTVSYYDANGTGGQRIVVAPEAEMVFVHCGDTDYGRRVRGSDVRQLAEMLFAARTGSPASSEPKLTDVTPVPYDNALPEPKRYTRVELSPAILDRYIGDYKLVNGAVLEITRHGGFLIGNLRGQGEADFHPTSETLFFADSVNATARFILDDTGQVEGIEISMMGQKLSAKPLKTNTP